MTSAHVLFPAAALLLGLALGVPCAAMVRRYLRTLPDDEYDTPGPALVPCVATATGVLALALAVRYGAGPHFAVYLAFGIILATASFIDLYSFILPDSLTLPLAVLAPAASILVLDMPPLESLGGAATGAGLFWLLQVAYRKVRGIEGLGTGDIKLMLCLGALTGLSLLPLTILLSCFAALAAALGIRLRGAEVGMQTALPFGPFLCIGTALTITAGHAIMNWYLGLVL
ncbi:leader peptidase (prepilin peptidase)/N-methyltransferase [Desulfobaculum xiamenense]|uniref:Leader peptidase (Prepilin peptidase)/N-methyltransferase n=1 Tax=Desulfobaculum xiamenense TaxID=995050 RepID=A0A846QT59_9BACT|nr:A24 family peptidase [Desulfobaculum xiamenense]NJB68645.1 leader peptidase (prepilin peptidase)/N-methyltransferase [Desulfobaculum xiamenense]